MRIADYYKNHLSRVKVLSLILIFSSNLVLYTLLVFLNISVINLICILLVYTVLGVIILTIVLKLALDPLNLLNKSIAHVSPEPSDVVPPQVNDPRLAKTGLKQLIQTIYDIAANASQENSTQPAGVSSDLASSLIEGLPAGLIALDTSGNIIYHNSLAPVTTNDRGESQIELIFDSNESLQDWLDDCDKNKVSNQHSWFRIPNKLPDASNRIMYDIIAHYQKDASVETVVILIDRTDYYKASEEDMDFIALAAHELRGPITIIRGYLDVFQEELGDKLTNEQNQLLDRLNVSSSKLTSYISNILNVSRYDRRHLNLHLTEDSLAGVYAVIADDMKMRATTQGRLLSVDIPDNMPTIAADRASLGEVMMNLIDNAIKYSHEGGNITVTATSDDNFVNCSVVDHGIGIPSSLIGSLFTKFYRSHRSRQSVQGTGLGLYISKAIIESHGGKIGVSSREGQGSTFTFSVPVYFKIKDKLIKDNSSIIKSSSGGWIKNHSTYRS